VSYTFSGRFYRELSQVQEHALKLEMLCKEKGFAERRDEMIAGHRDGVLWAQEVIARVLTQLTTDQGDLFNALPGTD
jgi:hypothetical protein